MDLLDIFYSTGVLVSCYLVFSNIFSWMKDEWEYIKDNEDNEEY